jgi:hypothetical protein
MPKPAAGAKPNLDNNRDAQHHDGAEAELPALFQAGLHQRGADAMAPGSARRHLLK